MSMVMDGFSVSDKATKESKSTRSDAVVVDLGVKLQRIESFPCKMMMMMGHHDNHHRPFYEIGDGDTCNNRAKSSDIYDVVGVGGVSGAAVASGGAAVGVRALQPFDISPTKSTATATTLATHTAFKSPGGMAASLGFPFTSAQWKELERQAMIYKYMMASLPVPSDLLFPILRHPSIPATSHPSLGSGLNLRFSKGGDQEPGRCRRTDGKKWRCSRDVAPDQKYCERHMHRGRPRSRKHVELPANNKKTRINGSLPTSSVTVPAISNNNGSTSQFVGSIAQSYRASTFEPVTSASSYKEPRSLDWMMKGETVPMPTTDQQWQHLMQQTKIGLNIDNSYCDTNSSSVLNQRYREEPLNLNSYASFNAGKDHSTTQYPLFLNPNLISHTQTPRGFIDAWSNHGVSDDHNTNSGSKSSISSNGKLSLSSLTLSMGGNSIDEDMSQNHECGTKSSSWLTPSSWTASTPGGPLAEVLRPSKVSATIRVASKPSSPIAGDGDLSSPPATAVSSPSGVLQKTLASLSDSSGSSSPTLAGSSAKPEIALMWLKQGNLASSVLGRE